MGAGRVNWRLIHETGFAPWVFCECNSCLQPVLSWSIQQHLPLLPRIKLMVKYSFFQPSNQLLKVTTTGGWLLWRGPSFHLNTSRKFNFLAQPAFAKAAFTFCSRTMFVKSSSSSAISSSIQSLSIPCTNTVLFFLTKETKWKEWFANWEHFSSLHKNQSTIEAQKVTNSD